MLGTLTIGRLAKAASVNVETIRYYQRRGLIGEPRKPPGGQRRYSIDVLRRIAFIRRAQQLGFTLEEIGQLLKAPRDGPARNVLPLAQQRLAITESRVAELGRMRRELGRLIAACKRKGLAAPLLDALDGDE